MRGWPTYRAIYILCVAGVPFSRLLMFINYGGFNSQYQIVCDHCAAGVRHGQGASDTVSDFSQCCRLQVNFHHILADMRKYHFMEPRLSSVWMREKSLSYLEPLSWIDSGSISGQTRCPCWPANGHMHHQVWFHYSNITPPKQRGTLTLTKTRLSYLEVYLYPVVNSLLQRKWGLLEVLQVSWKHLRTSVKQHRGKASFPGMCTKSESG